MEKIDELLAMQHIEPLSRLNKEVKQAAKLFTKQEVRFLVDRYYQIQEQRITAAAQDRASSKDSEPNLLMGFLADQTETLEKQIRNALDTWSQADELAVWMRGIKGIGPVIASGFCAHLDITKANTQGKFLSYCGQLEGQKRKKGEKIKWNPALKRLSFLLGESFVKVSGYEDDVYGKLYLRRKIYENEKNARGDYADQAAAALTKKFGEETQARTYYTSGKLPPGHIHARCKKWAVKIFLSHLHDVAFALHYEMQPPIPYPFAYLGHVDYIPIPNFNLGKYPAFDAVKYNVMANIEKLNAEAQEKT